MKIVVILLICLAVFTVLYLLMIMPRRETGHGSFQRMAVCTQGTA